MVEDTKQVFFCLKNVYPEISFLCADNEKNFEDAMEERVYRPVVRAVLEHTSFDKISLLRFPLNLPPFKMLPISIRLPYIFFKSFLDT